MLLIYGSIFSIIKWTRANCEKRIGRGQKRLKYGETAGDFTRAFHDRNGVAMDNQMNQYDNGGGYNNGNRGGGPGGPGGGGNGQPPRRPNVLIMILLGLSAVMITFMFYNLLLGGGSSAQEVEYTQFLKDLEDGRVERVEVNVENAEILVTLKQTETDAGSPGVEEYYTPLGMLQIQQNREYSTLLMESMDTLTERLEQHGVEGKRTINNSSEKAVPWVWERATRRCMFKRKQVLLLRMWPGRTRQRNPLWRLWISCTTPENIPRSAQSFPREPFW